MPVRHSGFALRAIGRNRLFAVAAVTSIALAVGANAAIFSIVNRLWLRSTGVQDPDRIVVAYRPVTASSKGELLDFHQAVSREGLETLDGLASVTFELNTSGRLDIWRPVVRLAGTEEVLQTAAVAYDYFETLGVPVRGRTFTPADDRLGAEPVAIISHAFWRHRLGGRTDAIGSRLDTTGGRMLVAGIAPPWFRGARLGDRADLWLPLGVLGQFADVAAGGVVERITPLTVYARLREGVTKPAAESQVRSVLGPGASLRTLADLAFPLRFEDDLSRQTSLLRALWAASLLVFVLGCANLASLLLARAESRTHEWAVRRSLGAGASDLFRLALAEAMALSAIGLAAGLVVRHWLLTGIDRLQLPIGLTLGSLGLQLDAGVVAFGFAIALLTVLVATVPAGRVMQCQALSSLLAGSAPAGSAARLHLRQWLLFAQVAMATALLGTGLALGGNVAAAFRTDFGFASSELAFISLRPRASAHDSDEVRRGSYALLIDRIQGLPGIRQVTFGSRLLGGPSAQPSVTVRTKDGLRSVRLAEAWISPEFMSTIGARRLQGRDLVSQDVRRAVNPIDVVRARGEAFAYGTEYVRPSRTPAVIVDRTLATALWPGEPAVGQLFSREPLGITYEVVGVVEPIRRNTSGDSDGNLFQIAALHDDDGSGALHLVARTIGDPEDVLPAIRVAVRQLFPDPALLQIDTAQTLIRDERSQELMGARVYTWFGLLTATVGLCGVFGLVSFLVLRSRRELGIRAALGGTRQVLVRIVVVRALKPSLAGAAGGLFLAHLLSSTTSHLVSGVETLDSSFFARAAALFAFAALLASLVGAAGVRRIDPSELLRSQ